MSVDSIPTEVWLEIVTSLSGDRRSLGCLRQANSYFHQLCTPQLFRHIELGRKTIRPFIRLLIDNMKLRETVLSIKLEYLQENRRVNREEDIRWTEETIKWMMYMESTKEQMKLLKRALEIRGSLYTSLVALLCTLPNVKRLNLCDIFRKEAHDLFIWFKAIAEHSRFSSSLRFPKMIELREVYIGGYKEHIGDRRLKLVDVEDFCFLRQLTKLELFRVSGTIPEANYYAYSSLEELRIVHSSIDTWWICSLVENAHHLKVFGYEFDPASFEHVNFFAPRKILRGLEKHRASLKVLHLKHYHAYKPWTASPDHALWSLGNEIISLKDFSELQSLYISDHILFGRHRYRLPFMECLPQSLTDLSIYQYLEEDDYKAGEHVAGPQDQDFMLKRIDSKSLSMKDEMSVVLKNKEAFPKLKYAFVDGGIVVDEEDRHGYTRGEIQKPYR